MQTVVEQAIRVLVAAAILLMVEMQHAGVLRPQIKAEGMPVLKGTTVLAVSFVLTTEHFSDYRVEMVLVAEVAVLWVATF